MTTVQVCGKWPLVIQPGTGGHYAYLDTASRKNPDAFLRLVQDLPTGMRVREFFGGVGLFSTVIQQVLRPQSHVATDIEPDCVRQLATIPGVQARVDDAKNPQVSGLTTELVALDFPVYTIRSHLEWAWSAYLLGDPRYVVVASTALPRLGLHRNLYSSLLGATVRTHADYVNAYSEFMHHWYGYSVTREVHHRYSYMLLEPVRPKLVTPEKL